MIEIAFAEGDSKSFETPLKQHMENPIKHYEKELASIRTGRASIALLEKGIEKVRESEEGLAQGSGQ